MRVSPIENLLCQLLGVIDAAHGGDGEGTVMGAHQQWLGLVVRDTADAQVSLHLLHIPVKFSTERGVLDIVNGTVKAVLSVDGHAATACSQVGMIICSEKQVKQTVALGSDTKKSSHRLSLFLH